jgi:hypothetical protein
MICPTKPITQRQPKHCVDEILKEELGDWEVVVELLESEKDVARWNKLIRKHHYLKEHRLVGESLRYVATRNGEWVALLGWSSCAFHLRPRDAWIGWNDHQRKARRPLVACNARFVILKPKSAAPGLASQIVSRNLRRLSSDWQKHYGHPIALVETFVDPERFEGTCYRASNWIEIGVSKGFGRSRLDFYQLHDQPKTIFVYPLIPEAREILCAPEMPADWASSERMAKPMEYPLSGQQTKSLLDALAEGLTDPRRYRRGRVHRKVASIVAIATAAIIAGNNSFIDLGEFSTSLNQNQLRSLRASRDRITKKYLAPSETTIRRVIQRLDPDELDKVVTEWLRSHLKDLGMAQLAVDGKCARTASKINGQTFQLFSALDTQTRMVARQIQIPSKTNEIPALKDLLDPLDIRGALVSADAIQTQKKSAEYIVEKKQADFLMVVKANQPKLFNKLAKLSQASDGVFFPSGHHSGPGTRPA